LWGDDPTPHSQERREMAEEVYSRGNIEDDIRAGRPEGYFDYIYKTYGTIFQAGSIQGLEAFRELLRQILALGNERSILLFAERFFPLLPQNAKRKIFAEFLTELERIKGRTQAENFKRRQELLRKPATSV
jgi:hypothetical protein